MITRVIFLGPPGAGKGTIAGKLSLELNIPHISTGDLFRSAIKKETDLGKQVQVIVGKGGLVPDSITIALVQERLKQPDTARGYIFDGFPRTIPQADALSQIASINKVIDFSLSDEEVIKRLSGRRVCRNCGKNFHIAYLQPRIDGICDYCGGDLYTREDDKIESIKNRLVVYKTQTEPLIKYYTDKGILESIDASPVPETVYKELKEALSLI